MTTPNKEMEEREYGKVCSNCGIYKLGSRFDSEKRVKDRLSAQCRECANKKGSLYRQKNKKRFSKTAKERRLRNPTLKKKGVIAVLKSQKKYPEKHHARYLVKKALINGGLTKKPCEICGKKKVEGHHKDYSKPLKVNWLCRSHHMELHRKYGN